MQKNPAKPPISFSDLSPRAADGAALVGGLLLPLAFSPFELFPLALLAPAALFAMWRRGSAARAAWRGFLFGLGMFGVGVSWVYVSLHNYGNMPAPLAALAVFFFVAVLALYPAALGYIQARFCERERGTHATLLLPALWVLFEWVRGWFLTGFPWLHLGYSQADTPLAGYAPWLGVYGVSLAVALSAGWLAQCLHTPEQIARRYLPALLGLWAGGWLAAQIPWARPVDAPLRVALVQGNVTLADKWRPERRPAILDLYRRLSQQASEPSLVVWPESAIPAYLHEIETAYLEDMRRLARERGMDFLIGVIERDPERGSYYNSVISLGRAEGAYRKQHLVPFGEFLPLKPALSWLLGYLQIPMSDFSAGPREQPLLTAAGQKLGVSVCYEDAFGEEVIAALPEATLLVNVSEDAWFGDSLAPHQRLQMARLRALESARPMLRAANTGPSAVIDHRGAVVARSPQFKTFVLAAEVQPMQGLTPYGRTGNWSIVGLLIGMVLYAGFRRRGKDTAG